MVPPCGSEGIPIDQDRKRPSRLALDCGDYQLKLLTPADVSPEWPQWLADPKIMLPLGVKPRPVNRRQLANYIIQCQAQQRALVGIFDSKTRQHLGLVEIGFARTHMTATVELLIGTRRWRYAEVAGTIVPILFRELARRFGIAKFIAIVPETHPEALAYFSASDWTLEAELAEELSSEAHGRRLNVKQFGWFSPAKVA